MNILDRFKVIKICLSQFPKGVTSKNALDFLLKDNCPLCLSQPLEALSNYEYSKKYPAKNIIDFGATKIYLCDHHLLQFKKSLVRKYGTEEEEA